MRRVVVHETVHFQGDDAQPRTVTSRYSRAVSGAPLHTEATLDETPYPLRCSAGNVCSVKCLGSCCGGGDALTVLIDGAEALTLLSGESARFRPVRGVELSGPGVSFQATVFQE